MELGAGHRVESARGGDAMTTLTRRSPIMPWTREPRAIDLRDSINQLENQPAIPSGTPASSAADGYEGQICSDANYVYLYRSGSWKRAALSSF